MGETYHVPIPDSQPESNAMRCHNCNALLAYSQPRYFIPHGSTVEIRADRLVKLRCPGCGRTRLWRPTNED